MRNWQRFVEERLALAGLPPARAAHIVRELASQLEDFYLEARGSGLSDEEADAHARAQITDWARMAADVGRAAGPAAGAPDPRADSTAHRRGGLMFIAELGRDLRLAVRQWQKAPGFTVVAIVTLALGIGATTAVFSLVNGVLLRPLPYRDASRLVSIWEKNADGSPDNVGYATYRDWQAQNHTFAEMAVYSSWQPVLQVGEPEPLNGLRVTSNYFRMLGVRPELGRDFLPSEDTPATLKVVMLSHALWVRRFNADPRIVGRAIAMNATSYLVAGVLPESYQSLMNQDPRGGTVEIWRVLGYDVSQPWACRTCHHLIAVGRLRDGVTAQQAEADVSTISGALMRAYPKDYPAGGVLLTPLRDQLLGTATTPLTILFGAVACVLLVACANLANLLLARATNREREIAVRRALGAGHARIARQLLTENCLLASVGALAGLVPAYWTPPLLAAIGGTDLPRLAAVRLDWHVVVFAVGTALLTGIVSGLAPLHRLSRLDLQESLREGPRGGVTRTSRRIHSTLIVVEVALSLTLLVGAGLLLRSLSRLVLVSPGFESSHVLTMRTTALGPRYQDNGPLRGFFVDATARLRALPGVEAAAAASQIPLAGNIDRYGFHPEGKMHDNPELDESAERYTVTPGFLAAMRIPLRRGRDIGAADTAEAPGVILISESTAERIWPGEDALGKRVKVGGLDHPWLTVVGIVGDVHHIGLDVAPDLQMYIPHAQWPFPDSDMTFVIRTTGPPEAIAAAARQAVHAVDASLPLSRVLPLDAYVDLSVQGRRFALVLIGAFGAIALVLSVVGIYGVTAYHVAQRSREIAIRMSLGADQPAVLVMFLRQGAALVLTGAAIGITASLGLSRFLASLLFDLTPTDPLTFLLVTMLLIVVALTACWVPALRALRADPLVALRSE
jgi:putative ABC transport system permease protein